MALNRYLQRVVDLLDDNKRRCNREKACLEAVLNRLKGREDVLDAQLSVDQPDYVRKAIERERKVVFAQRRKGLKRLGALATNDSGSRGDTPHLAM